MYDRSDAVPELRDRDRRQGHRLLPLRNGHDRSGAKGRSGQAPAEPDLLAGGPGPSGTARAVSGPGVPDGRGPGNVSARRRAVRRGGSHDSLAAIDAPAMMPPFSTL